MTLYESNEKYLFDQTPSTLAEKLIQQLPIKAGDVLFEPFRGEGAFFNHFPATCVNHWAEIKEGRDYRSFTEEVDWVITNPPFRIEQGKNCFVSLLNEFSSRARKGICFLASGVCFQSLTPLRMKALNVKGWYLTRITVCNVKKWRGRYYFLQFTKEKNDSITFLDGNF